jgi:hypothetical protein
LKRLVAAIPFSEARVSSMSRQSTKVGGWLDTRGSRGMPYEYFLLLIFERYNTVQAVVQTSAAAIKPIEGPQTLFPLKTLSKTAALSDYGFQLRLYTERTQARVLETSC